MYGLDKLTKLIIISVLFISILLKSIYIIIYLKKNRKILLVHYIKRISYEITTFNNGMIGKLYEKKIETQLFARAQLRLNNMNVDNIKEKARQVEGAVQYRVG